MARRLLWSSAVMMSSHANKERLGSDVVDRAIGGDDASLMHLMKALTPVIRSQIVRILARQPKRYGRDVGQELDDLTQEIFVVLLDNDRRVLRQWDPARGRSLKSFVALVTERQLTSRLRTRRRNPWTEQPTANEAMEFLLSDTAHPERRLAARRRLSALIDEADRSLSPLGRKLFLLLMLRQASIQQVCADENMSAHAVYAWRSRLRRTLRHAAG